MPCAGWHGIHASSEQSNQASCVSATSTNLSIHGSEERLLADTSLCSPTTGFEGRNGEASRKTCDARRFISASTRVPSDGPFQHSCSESRRWQSVRDVLATWNGQRKGTLRGPWITSLMDSNLEKQPQNGLFPTTSGLPSAPSGKKNVAATLSAARKAGSQPTAALTS